ncbi:MAG: ATP synthase F0 subunit B [Deltaproteobacteria bacterium]|nr:ATP synthase F0 subunit B [Deltaproteobacteria bacterium]
MPSSNMTSPSSKTFPALLVALVAFLQAGGAMAQDAHHAAPHVANWWGMGAEHSSAPALGWLSITFFIFVAFMGWRIWRPLNVYLENRSDGLKDALEEARRAKEEAEAKAKDAEARLAKLEGEMGSLKAEFESQGKAESERLAEAGKITGARLAQDAEDTIAAEIQKATEALKQEASKIALQLAEERIRAAVNDDDEGRLRQNFLADVAQ